jgi:DNA-binding NtrC family response regulator
MKGCVLIVDDEPLKRVTLQIELTEAGYAVYDAAEPRAALRVLDSKPVDVVVTDLKMPGMDGLAFLEHVRARQPRAHVIMMTAYGSVDTAVAAMKRGAYDYITKPFSTEALLAKIEPLLFARRAGREDEGDWPGTDRVERFGQMVACSHAMRSVFEQIRMVADSERTILIQGESGTGKELVAEAIHQHSRRRDKPLIKFSFAALQPTVIESELFGHERGAFTGAIRQKAGRFELADGGTLFLDEVDDISPDLQVKLLRVIECQQFERVGGEAPVKVDVRLICATKKDLRQLVQKGLFRQDLYYRLHVIHLLIPPLRDRIEDMPVLVDHFVAKHAAVANGGRAPRVSPHAMEPLFRHSWPGNVREVEHVIERALAFCRGEELGPEHIPPLGEPDETGQHVVSYAEIPKRLVEAVADVETKMIASALRQASGNQARAAQLLGIPRTTLRDKIAKYGIASGREG